MATAAIAHALAIHHSDVSHSSPQSSVGVNMSIPSIPARYPGQLAVSRCKGQLAAATRSSRHRARAKQFELPVVVLLDGLPVADADHDRVGQFVPKQPVEHQFQAFVQRGGRLVEEHHLRLVEQDAGEGDALLFADRQHLGPVLDFVDPNDEVRQRHLEQRPLNPAPSTSPSGRG